MPFPLLFPLETVCLARTVRVENHSRGSTPLARRFIYCSAESITPEGEIISTREESNLGSANSANTGTGTGIPVLYQLYSTGTVLYSSYSAVFNIGK